MKAKNLMLVGYAWPDLFRTGLVKELKGVRGLYEYRIVGTGAFGVRITFFTSVCRGRNELVLLTCEKRSDLSGVLWKRFIARAERLRSDWERRNCGGHLDADEFFKRLEAEDPEFRALQQLPKPHVELALNVNRLRNARGMTQEELAAAAGMRQPRIAEVERGDANPKLHTITRLAMALGVEPWQLLFPAPTLVAADTAETVLAGR